MTRRLLRVVLWERGAVGQDAQSVRGVGFELASVTRARGVEGRPKRLAEQMTNSVVR